MFDDFVAYYHENVVGAFIEYQERSNDGLAGRSRDLRFALVAAESLFHLREHLPSASAISRALAESLCSDYGLLGDVVNAAKHRAVTRPTPHGAALVRDAANLYERLLFIEYEDEEGTYRSIRKTVTVTLTDGSERILLEVLTNVINFWEKHLCSTGVLGEARSFTYDPPIRHRTRNECCDSGLDFELVQGQRFLQTMQLLRFDQQTGAATPMDLSGSELKFRIYKPTVEVDVVISHEATGRELKKTITLSEEESREMSLINDDDERQAYVHGLPAAKAALKDLIAEAGLVQHPGNANATSREDA